MGERPTVDLFFGPEPETPRTRYSVGRARTESKRAQLVERVTAPTPVTPSRGEPRWRVEIVGERVWLRREGVVELPLAEARRIAEAILHHVG